MKTHVFKRKVPKRTGMCWKCGVVFAECVATVVSLKKEKERARRVREGEEEEELRVKSVRIIVFKYLSEVCILYYI